MECAPYINGLTVEEYRKLVENQAIYKLTCETLNQRNKELIDEIAKLREELEETKTALASAEAELKEAQESARFWFKNCQDWEAMMAAKPEEVPEDDNQ